MNASTRRFALILLGAAALGACAKRDQTPASSAAPAAPMQGNDQPAPTPAPAAPAAPSAASAPATRARVSEAPRRTPPVAEAPATVTAPAGTFLDVAADDTISSKTAKVGDPFTATVVAAVTDAHGHVVIPQGATVRGAVTQVGSGSLTLTVSGVSIRGWEYSLGARIDSLGTIKQSQKIGGKDVAKVGIGAAAGALLGRVIGGNAKGAVIGGVVGAAAGTGVAAKTHGSDVVLPKGAHINLTLTSALDVRAR